MAKFLITGYTDMAEWTTEVMPLSNENLRVKFGFPTEVVSAWDRAHLSEQGLRVAIRRTLLSFGIDSELADDATNDAVMWLSLHNVWRYEFQGDGQGTVNLGIVIAYMSGMEA